MVFCYKLITESPRRSLCSSPRKSSPAGRIPFFPQSVSDALRAVDYETCDGNILDAIPEREWRLLAALARKREENEEREILAEQFHKMWQKEKQEREMLTEEVERQYRHYIHGKRTEERSRHEQNRLHRYFEQELRKDQLISSISHKERQSAELLACIDDKKVIDRISRTIEEEARMLLAADRRMRLGAAAECRRRAELAFAQRRVDEARRRRNSLLRDVSQRVAIQNALTSWESSIVRQETSALETACRAAHAARAARSAARAERIARSREESLRRARRAASVARELRDAVRSSR